METLKLRVRNAYGGIIHLTGDCFYVDIIDKKVNQKQKMEIKIINGNIQTTFLEVKK